MVRICVAEKGMPPEHSRINAQILGDLCETHALLIDSPERFFFKLFRVTSSFRHDTPPCALSRFLDVSTKSGLDQPSTV
jgi:hypothetical protein